MKKLYNILFCGIVVFASTGSLAAQDSYPYAQGYLLSRYRSYTDELPILSSVNNGFGTARSIAMGSAYTSLGADLSSMGINPAGLGMYQSSEFGVSLNMSVSKYKNSSPLIISDNGRAKANFAPNNIGVALNFYQGLGDLTSFTFGFSYNRLADYNYRGDFSMRSDHMSLGEVFALQLFGIPRDWLDNSRDYTPWGNPDMSPKDWGAILGVRTGLVGVHTFPADEQWKNIESQWPDEYPNKYEELENKTYYLRGVDLWETDRIASVSHRLQVDSRGSAGEYNIAGGFNIKGHTYIGFSLGLQDIYRRQNVTYTETYTNNSGADMPANSMTYSQYSRMSGSGFNFKIGAIFNPVAGLRLGLAFHTPTWSTVTKHYSASMETVFPSNAYYDNSDTWEYDYDYNTHGRLLTGVSYTFGNKGLIALDYECDFYNWMRIRVPDYVPDDEFETLKQTVKETYKPRHIVRVGGEYKVTPAFALRAGFAYNGSFLKKSNEIYNEPLPYKSMNLSAGIGYRFNNKYSLDLTYVFMKTNYTGYELFYYYGPDNNLVEVEPNVYASRITEIDYGRSNAIKSELFNHNAVLSFNIRF